MNRRIILSFVILMVIFCLGASAILTCLYFASKTPPDIFEPSSIETPTVMPAESSPARPSPLDTPLPVNPPGGGSASASSISPELAGQMDEIQHQVSALRGLQPVSPVTRALLTPSELAQKVKTDFFKDYSVKDAREDALLLRTLGLLPRDFDLIDLYTRLYSEQIAGYYDSETKEMYVVKGQAFGGIERMTYAHEFTHTLQDQNYDLQDRLKINAANCRIETEYCSAVTALLEGDATYTEQQWLFNSATGEDRSALQKFTMSYSSPVYDAAPRYLQDDFLFPYKQGLEFVYSLNDRGGYALVDDALKNPPVTTEQILHPDKYPDDRPLEISLPDFSHTSLNGWQEVEQNELGEWYTYLILADGFETKYQLPKTVARDASAGWGGDRYVIYLRPADNAVIFLLHSRWDSEPDAREFFTALRQYGQERWGTPTGQDDGAINWQQTADGTISIESQGADTIWLITPDEATRKAVLAEILPFNTP